MFSRIAILKPLQHRPFRLLFAGQAISDLGDWLDILAVITLIAYRWDLGAGALAALSVALALPWAFIAPVAGVWVDRWPRKTTMISADLIRAVIVLGLIWAPNLYSVLALVFLKGVFSTFFGPARQATIRSTVPKEDLLAANSLSQLSTQTTKVLGPSIGGLLVAVAGPQAAFAVDAGTYLASAAILSFLPHLTTVARRSDGEEPRFWDEFKAGLSYIRHRRALAIAISGMAAALFIVFTFDSLAALALKALGGGEALLGLAVGAVGIGTTLGAALIGQWGNRFHPFAIMAAGEIAAGSMVAVVGVAVALGIAGGTGAAWIPVWLVIGLGAAAMIVPYGYILQSETPPELLGRVSASANAMQTTCQLIAPPLGAAMAGLWGVGTVFAATGGALALVGVALLFIRPQMGVVPATVDSSSEVTA